MGPEPEFKRRKLAPLRRPAPSPAAKKDTALPLMNRQMANEAQMRIQEAKNQAVKQAQQDCCTGNFKIFDSPFGNYFLPVIPSPAELG
ncbi:hypothetical protein LguiA_005054 [Lonicera macranthoides]